MELPAFLKRSDPMLPGSSGSSGKMGVGNPGSVQRKRMPEKPEKAFPGSYEERKQDV